MNDIPVEIFYNLIENLLDGNKTNENLGICNLNKEYLNLCKSYFNSYNCEYDSENGLNVYQCVKNSIINNNNIMLDKLIKEDNIIYLTELSVKNKDMPVFEYLRSIHKNFDVNIYQNLAKIALENKNSDFIKYLYSFSERKKSFSLFLTKLAILNNLNDSINFLIKPIQNDMELILELIEEAASNYNLEAFNILISMISNINNIIPLADTLIKIYAEIYTTGEIKENKVNLEMTYTIKNFQLKNYIYDKYFQLIQNEEYFYIKLIKIIAEENIDPDYINFIIDNIHNKPIFNEIIRELLPYFFSSGYIEDIKIITKRYLKYKNPDELLSLIENPNLKELVVKIISKNY